MILGPDFDPDRGATDFGGVNSGAINRLTDALFEPFKRGLCEGCQEVRAVHNDHTIAKARCKVIHKTELIYDLNNFVDSCERCHKQWEAFKTGDYLLHKNVEQRLAYMKEHDPEGYNERIHLTELSILQQLKEKRQRIIESHEQELRKEKEVDQ